MVTDEEIRKEYEAGVSYGELAKKHRMSISALSKIIKEGKDVLAEREKKAVAKEEKEVAEKAAVKEEKAAKEVTAEEKKAEEKKVVPKEAKMPLDLMDELRTTLTNAGIIARRESIINIFSHADPTNLGLLAELLRDAGATWYAQKLALRDWAERMKIAIPEELLARAEELAKKEEEKKAEKRKEEEEKEPGEEMLESMRRRLKTEWEIKHYKKLIEELEAGKEPAEKFTLAPRLDERGEPVLDKGGKPIMDRVSGAMDMNTWMIMQMMRRPREVPAADAETKERLKSLEEKYEAERKSFEERLEREREERHKLELARIEDRIVSPTDAVIGSVKTLEALGYKIGRGGGEGASAKDAYGLIGKITDTVKEEIGELRKDVKEVAGKPTFKPAIERTPEERRKMAEELLERKLPRTKKIIQLEEQIMAG